VPPKRRGRIAAIVALVVLAGAGGLFVLWPRLHRAADNTSTGTPAARTAMPAVGLCYNSLPSAPDVENTADTDPVVPCDQQHYLETFAVGLVDDAAANSPPGTDPLLATLYNKCSDLAEQFLGQPWPSTFSWVILSLPGDTARTNGAHWYRCDIAGNTAIGRQNPKTTTGSMHWKAPPITCFNVGGGAVTPLDCTNPHNGEVVSAWTVPASQSTQKPDGTRCAVDVDNFINADISTVPGLQAVTFTTQSYVVDQIILCVVQPKDPARTFSASLKNIGNKPLPYTP
jgi:hypothetical protein